MKKRLIILFSFMMAMILAVLPLPRWISLLWPDWIVLVLIYWTVIVPCISVGWAWVIGLLLDILFGSVLGAHALAMVCVAYITARFGGRIRFFSLFQQMAVVFVLVSMYRVILFWIMSLTGNIPHTLLYWLPIITSTIFWPWILGLLRDSDHYFKISI